MDHNIKVRKSVFETNSSSSHSLTLSKDDLVKIPFSKEILKEGELVVDKGEFGWEWARLYRPDSKIKYLITQLFDDDIPDGNITSVNQTLSDENNNFKMLCETVKEYTGVNVLIQPGSSGYIDHDSVGNGLEIFKDKENLKKFLFSDGYIETGNDNDARPFKISTDLGKSEFYYSECFRQPEKEDVELTLKFLKYNRHFLETENGAFIDANDDILEKLTSSGVVISLDWQDSGRYDYGSKDDRDSKNSSCSYLKEANFNFTEKIKSSRTFIETDTHGESYAIMKIMVPAELKMEVDALVFTEKEKPQRMSSN